MLDQEKKDALRIYAIFAANIMFAMFIGIRYFVLGADLAEWLYVPGVAYLSFYVFWIYRGTWGSSFFWPDKSETFEEQLDQTLRMDLYIFRDELPLATKLKWGGILFFYDMLFLLPALYLVVTKDSFAYLNLVLIAMIPFHMILKKKGIMK